MHKTAGHAKAWRPPDGTRGACAPLQGLRYRCAVLPFLPWLLSVALQAPVSQATPLPATPTPVETPNILAPPMEGAVMARPDGTPARPVPVRRPWWALGVSQRAYRMVLPSGPDTGTLD